MTQLILKSNIRKIIKELDPESQINNVAIEVEQALEQNTKEVLTKAIQRAKANQRRTLLARDL